MKRRKQIKLLIALLTISAIASLIFVLSVGIEQYLLVVAGAMLGAITVWLVVDSHFSLERKRIDYE